RPGHELAHGAVLAAVARELDARTEIAVAVAAGPAGAAPDSRVDRDQLAAPGAVLDPAGGLVGGHPPPGQGRVTDLALAPPVQVRTADADGGHPHQAHSGAGFRHRLVFHPEIADRVQPRRLHAPWPFLVPGPA